MVYNVNKVEGEAKQCRAVITHHLVDTIKTVSKHDEDIVELKDNLNQASNAFKGLKVGHENLSSKMSWMEEKVSKTYEIACDSKQRSTKGNFIVTGDDIPKYSPNEDLFQIVSYSLYQKYGVTLMYHDLKALHRLPGNRIIFALHSRLPGMIFEQLIKVMNSNPYPHLKVYVSIQLFEPFSELFFTARRLKQYKAIAYYRQNPTNPL